MSAESSLIAVAAVTALLNEDTGGPAVLLPDGLPEPGRELIASLASLTVLSAQVAARTERTTEGEYLDRSAAEPVPASLTSGTRRWSDNTTRTCLGAIRAYPAASLDESK